MSVPISSQQVQPRVNWKNATAARGVPHAKRAPFTHTRHEPCADLGPFVEHYWHIGWDLPAGLEHTQATLPHPSVHLVHEQGRWRLYGVQTEPFTRTLRGRDQVFGVKFRPGMFRGFWGADVATLTNRIEVGTSVLLDFSNQLPEDLPSLEAKLRARMPATDPASRHARDIVTRIASDPTLLRAEQVATASGLQLRALQRLFRSHVGVGVKWVIRRYRLHEALARIDVGDGQEWAAFALDLGYADQSHFINDFRSLVGVSPAQFR